ncbi:MAG: phage head closure protein [Devosia sp.]
MSGAMPPIGGLTDRVQLQRRDLAPETEGGHVASFMPIVTLWARVTAIGAREAQLADGRSVSISHTVVLRHRTDVRAGDRFLYRGRHLYVVSAEDLSGRKRFLGCRCAETMVVG